MTKTEQRKNIKALISELRKTKCVQKFHALHDMTCNGFCFVGLMTKVFVDRNNLVKDPSDYFRDGFLTSHCFGYSDLQSNSAFNKIMDYFGIDFIDPETQMHWYRLNDLSSLSFKEFADKLERIYVKQSPIITN